MGMCSKKNGCKWGFCLFVSEAPISGEEIDSKQLIDNHYYSIASKATILKPSELNVPKDMFKDKFNADWDETIAAGKVYNAMDACKQLGVDAAQLNDIWATTKKAGKLVKFGGGFYCGYIDCVEGKEPIYAMNGFFMQMRSNYVEKGASIYTYVVEWDAAQYSWEDFRAKVLGPTDPVTAPEDSLRGLFYKNWKEYGLPAVPNVGDNAVHASASPFEALCEQMNWGGKKPEDCGEFGKQLAVTLKPETLQAWKNDPQVEYDGKKGSLFDSVEDMDSDACLAKLKEVATSDPNSALA